MAIVSKHESESKNQPAIQSAPNGRAILARATIADVALEAGVSVGTASRVLNHRRGVNAELKRRVEETARTLGYVRPVRARRAARETCPILTFVLSNRDFLHPVHARLLQGAEEYCEENGYFLIFKKLTYASSTPAASLVLPTLLRQHAIADCLILAGTNYPNLLEATSAARAPYILYGNNLVSDSPRTGVDQVRSDDAGGAADATGYLLRLGHQRICFIGDTSQPWFKERYDAYRTVMAESGLEPSALTVRLSDDPFHNGYSSTEALLRRKMGATAIFAGSDDVAFGVWEQLQQSGLRVPDDIALIGFGDLPDAQRRIPPLTTVRIEYVELGRQLARMAIQKAENAGVPLPETVLPTKLILRGTTWPIQRTASAAEISRAEVVAIEPPTVSVA
jgi:LacI family transcriptional regulator